MKADTESKIPTNVEIGNFVKIQLRRIEKFKEGYVVRVLSAEYNEEGVEVEIEGGDEGNVKRILDQISSISPDYLRQLIDNHENIKFEMKSSFQYDLIASGQKKTPVKNEKIVSKIMEELASFMNTKGGIVCLGVRDDKQIIGLEKDFELASENYCKKNGVEFTKLDNNKKKDNLKIEICNKLKKYFFKNNDQDNVKIEFVELEDKILCCLKAEMSNEPVFIYTEKKIDMGYFRKNDSSTVLYTISGFYDHIKNNKNL